MSNSVRPHRRQPTRLPRPQDSPGKNTGVGCHFLLQYMKGKTESEVAQSCPTLSDPMDCSPPGSSIHGIFQAEYWSGVPSPSLSAYFIYVVFIFPQNRLFFFIILNNQGSLRFTHMLCHFPSSSFLLEAHFFLCELISFFSVSCFQHLNFWIPRFGWWFGVLRLKSMPRYANLFHSLVSDSK